MPGEQSVVLRTPRAWLKKLCSGISLSASSAPDGGGRIYLGSLILVSVQCSLYFIMRTEGCVCDKKKEAGPLRSPGASPGCERGLTFSLSPPQPRKSRGPRGVRAFSSAVRNIIALKTWGT